MNTYEFRSLDSDDEATARQMTKDFKAVVKELNVKRDFVSLAEELDDSHICVNFLNNEKKSLNNELSKSQVLVNSLKSANTSLEDELSKSLALIGSLKSEIFVLVEKNLSLENNLNELSQASSSDNVNCFICVEDSVSNKPCINVDKTMHLLHMFLFLEMMFLLSM